MNYLRQLQNRRMMAPDGGGGSGTGAGDGSGADGAPGAGEGKAGNDSDTAGEGKTLTQEEVNKIISETIAKERKRAEALATKALTEAEKLASMSAEERAKANAEKREADLAQRELELTQRELRISATEVLAKRKLPASLADLLNYTDADTCNASIETVGKAFTEAVQAGVKEKLGGGELPKGGTKTRQEQVGVLGATLGKEAGARDAAARQAQEKLFRK